MAEVTERPLEGQISDDDLFKAATAPEAPPSEPPPEPVKETPAEPPPPPVAEPPPEHIPAWRLREEAEARRMAEDRARAMESRLAEISAHVQQNQKRPDFFENPDAATQELILRTLQPYAEEQRRSQMYNSKMIAEGRHGEDKVAQAEEAFLRARAEQALDPMDYEKVVQAPNRWDAVVRWHKQQSTLATYGEDPEAWFQKRLEQAMEDPKFQAQVIERAQKGAAGRPSMTRIPPSLSRSTAAANNAEYRGDLSDASLWAFANKR